MKLTRNGQGKASVTFGHYARSFQVVDVGAASQARLGNDSEK